MERLITPRQLKYLNILLVKALGIDHRKLYLKLFWKVDSSKDLTMDDASEIIGMFLEENPAFERNKAVALNKIYKELGQQELFPCGWIKD